MGVIWAYRDKEIADAVKAAAAGKRSLSLRGRATKAALGRPVHADDVLDISRISGIVSYESEELVLTAKAGTALIDLQLSLAARKQILPFEPPDWGPFFGHPDKRATIGGTLAANVSGPRRLRHGGPRDALLGFSAVNGFGESYKAGGRVVKNVTGYDLPKLMCGAFGTLGALTEVTLKILPAPQAEESLVLRGLSIEDGLKALRETASRPIEATGLAHVTPELARHLPQGLASDESLSLIRLDGTAEAVREAAGVLQSAFRHAGPRRIALEQSQALWKALSDLTLFMAEPGIVWRLTCPPAAAHAIVSEIGPRAAQFDAGGNIVFLLMDGDAESHARILRDVCARNDAQSMLFRAPDEVRARLGVFDPQPPALARLTRDVKLAFDPDRVFEPGRMYDGI
jgi:glycolate oxidase FAD binding subunit